MRHDPSANSVLPELNLLVRILDRLDAMVAYWDLDRTCVFANDAYRLWFGKGRDELIGQTMQQLLGPLYRLNLEYIEAAFAGEVQVFERDIPGPDGIVRHSLATYYPDFIDGQVRGIIVHVADVGRLKRTQRELHSAKERAEHTATHDFLTGLPNRVLLQNRVHQALLMAHRKKTLLAVLSIDLDDFKQVNDRHGHAEGDRFLVEVSTRMKANLRAHDTVTRTGGDEFLLIASDVDSPDHAASIAERVIATTGQPLVVAGSEYRPAISIGIALYPADGSTPQALIESADRALYLAKNSGKHRFAFTDEGSAPISF